MTAQILYVDYEGHPAPLTECFFSRGKISSTQQRYPPTTLTEVDSAYCPQCLSFHDKTSATRLIHCPKPSCKKCPICQSICSIQIEESQCFYGCASCQWTSKECNLTQTVQTKDDGTIDKAEMARALEQLGSALEERRQRNQQTIDKHFKSISEAWSSRVKVSSKSGVTSTTKIKDDWSLETLEKSIKERKQQLASPEYQGPAVERLSFEYPIESDTSSPIIAMPAALQNLHSLSTVESGSDLLPLPVSFRTRESRRCIADLAEGKPGILVKPKLNPLEGDTSLRTGHGQWWKKDSSAILVLPNVRIHRANMEHENFIFTLLKVTNPTIGAIRFRFVSSKYSGEVEFEKEKTSLLNDVLLDSISQEKANVKLYDDLVDLQETEVVELQSTEDSFLELGSKALELPPEVQSWTGEGVEKSGITLVTKSSSSAYFQLAVKRPVASEGTAKMFGVPFSLRIDVGNGSWETVTLDMSESEATFDLLFTYSV